MNNAFVGAEVAKSRRLKGRTILLGGVADHSLLGLHSFTAESSYSRHSLLSLRIFRDAILQTRIPRTINLPDRFSILMADLRSNQIYPIPSF